MQTSSEYYCGGDPLFTENARLRLAVGRRIAIAYVSERANQKKSDAIKMQRHYTLVV